MPAVQRPGVVQPSVGLAEKPLFVQQGGQVREGWRRTLRRGGSGTLRRANFPRDLSSWRPSTWKAIQQDNERLGRLVFKAIFALMFITISLQAHAASVCIIESTPKPTDDRAGYYIGMIEKNCSIGDILELPGYRVVFSIQLSGAGL